MTNIDEIFEGVPEPAWMS